MEWLAEHTTHGEAVLACINILVAAVVIWLGRRELAITIPCTLIFLFVAAIAIPSCIPARPIAYRNACINNLREIDNAKAEWAKTNHKSPSNVPTEEDLYGTNGTNGILRRKLVCPRGGTYTFGSVSENPTCSFADKGHKLE